MSIIKYWEMCLEFVFIKFEPLPFSNRAIKIYDYDNSFEINKTKKKWCWTNKFPFCTWYRENIWHILSERNAIINHWIKGSFFNWFPIMLLYANVCQPSSFSRDSYLWCISYPFLSFRLTIGINNDWPVLFYEELL